jgi:thiol-disulfide isomerase/thioredoxin
MRGRNNGPAKPVFFSMKLPALLLSATLAATGFAAEPTNTKLAEPRRVARGAEIQLADCLVPGKTVVFDFTSEYCPPCRMYDGPLKALHQKRDDIVVVKVDINRPGVKGIDWKSPVAQQYKMGSIPRFKIFDGSGKLVAEDIGDDKQARKMVNEWCEALGF